MARSLRIDHPGAWHHVVNRGARKQAIFLGEEDRVGFLRLLAVAHDRFGIEVNAFALMGNHYHVFARSREGRLSSAFHYIDGVFAQRFNRRHGFDGPLFRGRFLSRIVDSEGYLHRVVRYVHRNPVDAELVGSPEDWKWSSYPIFANSWRQRPHWLYDDALRLSGIRTAAQLQQDTVQRVDIPPMPPHDTSAAAVGSAEFVSRWMAAQEQSAETAAHYRRTTPRVSNAEILLAVSEAFGVGVGELVAPSAGRVCEARTLAIGLCQELSAMPLREIAQLFSYATSNSAGAAASRHRRLLQNPAYAQSVKKLTGALIA